MTFSNKKLLATLSLAALLASCSGSVDEQKNPLVQGQNTQMSSGQGSLMTLKSLSMSAPQGLKENLLDREYAQKYFPMRACIDTNIGRKLNFYDFNISGQGFESKTLTSDSMGCVEWEENVEVDNTKNTQYTKIKRIISLKGSEINLELRFGIDSINNKLINYNRIQQREVEVNTKSAFQEVIDMKQIRFTPKGFGEISPSNDQNVIDKPFQLFTCFNYRSNGKPMKREIIKATLINEETGREMEQPSYRLDESGCGQMSFSLMHDRYTNTRRIPFNLVVRSLNPKLNGATVERQVCLYPWSNSGWVFGHDTISGDCPRESVEQNQRARIFVDEVNYTFLGHDKDLAFEINKDLDLVIKKSYVVNMYPKIHYGNLLHTMDPIEPIYSGKFRLKVAFLAPLDGDIELTANNYHKFKVISLTSKIVEVESKRLKARIDMPIKFTDIPYIHTRTYAAIRLEPIEETENSVLPATAAGTFHASSKVFRSILHTQTDLSNDIHEVETKNRMGGMKELRNYLSDVFSQVDENTTHKIVEAQLNRKKDISSKERFEKALTEIEEEENVEELSLSVFKARIKNKFSKDGLNDLFEDKYKRKDLGRLCSLFFNSKVDKGIFIDRPKDFNYKKCVEKPETMIKVNAYSHIEELLTKPRLEFSNTIRIYNGTGTNSYHGTSDRMGMSRSKKLGLSISAKKDIFGLVSVGASGGVDISKMYGHDMQTGNSNRGDVGQSIDLYADKLTLGFEAVTNKCLLVEGIIKYKREIQFNGNKNSYLGGSIQNAEVPVVNDKKIKVCMPQQKEYVTESWYYVGEGHQFHTILRDRLSMAENKYVALIRGEKGMARFIEFVQQNVNRIFLKKVKKTILPDTYLKNTFSDFMRMFDRDNDLVDDGAIPGTVEKYNDIENGGDQYYGELPIKDFTPLKGLSGENRYE